MEKVRTGKLAGNLNNRKKEKITYSDMLHKESAYLYYVIVMNKELKRNEKPFYLK